MAQPEMMTRGWEQCDVIIVTGDAYIDHPSFGAALVGRFLEWLGYRVGVIAQPEFRNVQAFRALGPPRLFWGVTAGNLDSELACLTVMRKLRRNDAYSPDGRAGLRPRKATIVYAGCCRTAFPGVPVVIGGLEASLRRFPYYDYWTDRVRRSVLFDSKADLLVFGMAERSLAEVALRLREGRPLTGIIGTAEIRKDVKGLEPLEHLPSFEDVSAEQGKRAFLKMARLTHANTDPYTGKRLVQNHGDRWLVVHSPSFPLESAEMDAIHTLPFTRKPHPSYGNRRMPAYDMVRDSITIHRGCYGGCSFCAVSAHQGTVVTSRSGQGILDEIRRIASDSGFHGTISDLGGPTANMYGTGCKVGRSRCSGKTCLYPQVCPQLDTSHSRFTELLRAAAAIKGVKHVFVSSGLRFDLALADTDGMFLAQLVRHHVSGRLKVAPEHVSDNVLKHMRKPNARLYCRFAEEFGKLARNCEKPYHLVEYFVSGHPGCTLKDMVELALFLRDASIRPEQVQDYYPAPMTLSAAMFYAGEDPLTGEPTHVARSDREKALQRALLLSHKPEFIPKAREALLEAGRKDLIGYAEHCLVPPEDRKK